MHSEALKDRRYFSGTRLQMQKNRTSHKKLSGSFHDLDNTEEGKLVNSMNQEAFQVTRKAKTIQQDRMRGFFTSFLANFLQDYFHNLKKAKDQEKRFKKKIKVVVKGAFNDLKINQVFRQLNISRDEKNSCKNEIVMIGLFIA